MAGKEKGGQPQSERSRYVSCAGGPRGARGMPAVRAMTWEEVDVIRNRFNDLNPYDRQAVPDLLKLTEENFSDPAVRTGRREVRCFAVSAKRYALFMPGRGHSFVVVGSTELRATDMEDPDDAFDVADAKEHGLAQFLNPLDPENRDRDWIAEAWRYLIGEYLALAGEPTPWVRLARIARKATPRMQASASICPVRRLVVKLHSSVVPRIPTAITATTKPVPEGRRMLMAS